jgi:hypothetical protein
MVSQANTNSVGQPYGKWALYFAAQDHSTLTGYRLDYDVDNGFTQELLFPRVASQSFSELDPNWVISDGVAEIRFNRHYAANIGRRARKVVRNFVLLDYIPSTNQVTEIIARGPFGDLSYLSPVNYWKFDNQKGDGINGSIIKDYGKFPIDLVTSNYSNQ